MSNNNYGYGYGYVYCIINKFMPNVCKIDLLIHKIKHHI